MNRIHSIQKILDKDGFLKGAFRPGILGAETLDALCAWCMYKRHASATPDELIPSVDFPQFVGDLIQGVFNANLGITIKQMEAYVELLREAASSFPPFDKHDP